MTVFDSPIKTANQVSKKLVLGCGALVHELVALIDQNKNLSEKIHLRCLPAKLHNTPQYIAREVDLYLEKNAKKYVDIFVAYADCGTAGELDEVLKKHGARRLEGAHCYEFYAGTEAFSQITESEIGSFFLTDYLVKFFDRLVVESLGLDRYPELFDAYFKHYRKMVYLAQTESPKLQALAQKYAESFGLEYEYRYVGLRGLQPVIESVIQPDILTVRRQRLSNNVSV